MAIDPKLLEELESRQKKIKYAASQEKYDARHAKGDWTARERMSCLFDAGSFSEIGMHTKHHCSNFGMLKKDIPGDGIVTFSTHRSNMQSLPLLLLSRFSHVRLCATP